MGSIRGNVLTVTVAQVLAADFMQARIDRRGVCETDGFAVYANPRVQAVKVFHRISWSEPTLARDELLAWLDKYMQTLTSVGLHAKLMPSDVPYLKVERT